MSCWYHKLHSKDECYGNVRSNVSVSVAVGYEGRPSSTVFAMSTLMLTVPSMFLFIKCRWSCLHCDSVMADKVDQWVLCIRECYYFTSHPASAHLWKLKILVSLTFFFDRWILSHFLLLWILTHRDQKTLMNATLYCEKRTVLIPCSVWLFCCLLLQSCIN